MHQWKLLHQHLLQMLKPTPKVVWIKISQLAETQCKRWPRRSRIGGAIFRFRTQHLNHIFAQPSDVVEVVNVVRFEEEMLAVIGVFDVEPARIAHGGQRTVGIDHDRRRLRRLPAPGGRRADRWFLSAELFEHGSELLA